MEKSLKSFMPKAEEKNIKVSEVSDSQARFLDSKSSDLQVGLRIAIRPQKCHDVDMTIEVDGESRDVVSKQLFAELYDKKGNFIKTTSVPANKFRTFGYKIADSANDLKSLEVTAEENSNGGYTYSHKQIQGINLDTKLEWGTNDKKHMILKTPFYGEIKSEKVVATNSFQDGKVNVQDGKVVLDYANCLEFSKREMSEQMENNLCDLPAAVRI